MCQERSRVRSFDVGLICYWTGFYFFFLNGLPMWDMEKSWLGSYPAAAFLHFSHMTLPLIPHPSSLSVDLKLPMGLGWREEGRSGFFISSV